MTVKIIVFLGFFISVPKSVFLHRRIRPLRAHRVVVRTGLIQTLRGYTVYQLNAVKFEFLCGKSLSWVLRNSQDRQQGHYSKDITARTRQQGQDSKEPSTKQHGQVRKGKIAVETVKG